MTTTAATMSTPSTSLTRSKKKSKNKNKKGALHIVEAASVNGNNHTNHNTAQDKAVVTQVLQQRIETLQQELAKAQEELNEWNHGNDHVYDGPSGTILPMEDGHHDDWRQQSSVRVAVKVAAAAAGARRSASLPRISNVSAVVTTDTSITTTTAAAATLAVLPPPTEKRGYLFKWQDRSIGWGGTKWSLRFVTVEQGRLSYYRSHTEVTTSTNNSYNNTTSPRYVLTLRGCAVRDDGWKRNQRHASFYSKKNKNEQEEDAPPLDQVGAYFFLFSIYQRPVMNEDDSDSEPSHSGGTSSTDSDNNDDDDDEEEDDSEIVPLLRFSTPSLAEKAAWIQCISEQCAYCETEQYQQAEAARAAEWDAKEREWRHMAAAMPEAKEGTLPPLYFAPPPPPALPPPRPAAAATKKTEHPAVHEPPSKKKVHMQKSNENGNSEKPPAKKQSLLKKSSSLGSMERSSLFNNATTATTSLDSATSSSSTPPHQIPPPASPMKKAKSLSNLHSHHPTTTTPIMFVTKSKSQDAETVDSRSIKGYPPSKPMHRAAAPSYLSEEAPVQHYRGLFNLGILMLILSNLRLLLNSIRQHGFVLQKIVHHVQAFPSGLLQARDQKDAWQEFPFVLGFLLQVLFVLQGYAIERFLSNGTLSESVGIVLHHINAHAAMLVPTYIVWNWIDGKPVIGAILLLHATITWMKLLSYMHANQDYRLSTTRLQQQQQQPHHHSHPHHHHANKAKDTHRATLLLIEDLDPADACIQYPENITVRNLFYFWCAPTLTYQIAFPRTPRVNYAKVMDILFRMVIALAIFTFLVAQVVSPALDGLLHDLEAHHGTYTAGIMADYLLRLALTSTYLWLITFYFYFHLYLNLFAELLRFGDRVFYKDWWNSADASSFWRLWNMPVHYWLIRHMYFPCVRRKFSRTAATFVVFLFSAIMHEVLVSVPFHMVRPWSFLGMMMQIPLVAITKYLYRKWPGSSIGNIVFWISFCLVGQPMAVLLYTVDYQYGKLHPQQHYAMNTTLECPSVVEPAVFTDECRIRYGGYCLIR